MDVDRSEQEARAVSDDLHLTRDQLAALTGTVQPKRMVAWLEARHWVFEPPARRGDIPKVAIAYHAARMSGQPATGKARARPNTDWMTTPA
jgi:hypothetical protein